MKPRFAGPSRATVPHNTHSQRWWNAIGGLKQRRTVRELSRKSDRLLRDIGLTRETIGNAVRDER
jgi:uncharacterized protein YjiS (DUF1127 family)